MRCQDIAALRPLSGNARRALGPIPILVNNARAMIAMRAEVTPNVG
jgi:hypothetical protein